MADAFDYNESAVTKCENCGADMFYDPQSNLLRCPYCESQRRIDKRVPIGKRDYYREAWKGNVAYDGDAYKCPNCGGDIKLPPFATAVTCPFCSATNVIKAEDIKGLKPDTILPFSISKEQASVAGKKWIKKKLFAPYKLKKEFRIENFNGVYIPSFGFTTDTISKYKGQLGETRTRYRGSGKNRHAETYIHWYSVSGTHSASFDDVAIEASLQLEQKELDKILPFDMDNAEAYNKDYIAGFTAERYDTSLDDSFEKAKDKMNDIIKRQIVDKYGADHVGYLNIDTEYYGTKFRYTLLPLWVCAYKYKKKGYRFLINGRTGKSTGKTPLSPLRIGTVVLLVLGLIALIAWLIISNRSSGEVEIIYPFKAMIDMLFARL